MDELTAEDWLEIDAQIGGRYEALKEVMVGNTAMPQSSSDLLARDIADLEPLVKKTRQRLS